MGKMDDGAPCEQADGQVQSASLLGQEVPGYVPDGGRTQISSKKAWQARYHHGRRLRPKAVASAQNVRALVDRG